MPGASKRGDKRASRRERALDVDRKRHLGTKIGRGSGRGDSPGNTAPPVPGAREKREGTGAQRMRRVCKGEMRRASKT